MTAVSNVRGGAQRAQRVLPGAHGAQRILPGVPSRPPRPPLTVVPRRRPGLPTRRRRRRALVMAGALLVALGMLAVVVAHVVLTQRQYQLDRMTQELSQARVLHDQLQLRVAQLESPSRIVATAEQHLHMVVPPRVVYLSPGAQPASTKLEGTPASPSSANPATVPGP